MTIPHSQRIPTRRPRATRTRQPKKELTPVEKALQLDTKQSEARLKQKTAASLKRWGKNWKDMVRTGRRFTRVERIDPITADAEVTYVLRTEPGWEWTCQNCKTRSLVTESPMIAIYTIDGVTYRDDVLKAWEELAAKTVARGFKPPEKPTATTAGCPNCKYRPGSPE
jgi:hypothetical protein